MCLSLSHPVLRTLGPCCFAIPVPWCHPTSWPLGALPPCPGATTGQPSFPACLAQEKHLSGSSGPAGLAGVVLLGQCPQMCGTELCCELSMAHRWIWLLSWCVGSWCPPGELLGLSSALLCSSLLKVAPFSFPLQPTTLPQGTINMNQCTDVVDGEGRTGQKFSLCILTPEKEHFIRAENKEIISG